MATSSFSRALTSNKDWVEVVNGATYKRFGIKASGNFAVQICIATSVPSNSTDDYFVLDSSSSTSEFSEELDATDKVYARATGVTLRGYRVTR